MKAQQCVPRNHTDSRIEPVVTDLRRPASCVGSTNLGRTIGYIVNSLCNPTIGRSDVGMQIPNPNSATLLFRVIPPRTAAVTVAPGGVRISNG
jgi:hypothetical protein